MKRLIPKRTNKTAFGRRQSPGVELLKRGAVLTAIQLPFSRAQPRELSRRPNAVLLVRLGIFLLLTLSSCFSRSAAMTPDTYSMIQLGTPASDLASTVGEPYAIHNKGNGVKEYEYIERIRNERTLIGENHYFITVQDGKVVSKRVTREKQKDYDLIYDDDPNWDSYNAFPGSFP